LTWSATFTADSYIVLRSLGNDVNSATSIGEVTATDSSPSYQDWDATPQTTYTYWIRAASAVGTGAASASATGQASSIDLVATQGEFADRVELNWLVTAAASSFEIWRGQTGQFATANKLGDVSIQQYVDTPPTGGQFYYYWVRIADSNARSSATAGWRGAPPIATTATASRGNANSITVTWGPLPASSYEVRRAAQADGSDAVAIGTASDASFTDTVAVGARFYYAVSGINEFGTGPTSPFVAGWSGGFLQPPTQISVSQGVADKVNLSWTTAEATLATEIWRSTTADFANSAEIAAISAATVYADSGTVPGTRYWYRLRSSHIDDTSAYSAISEGSRPGTRPDGVTATSLTRSDGIQVTWDAQPNALHYAVHRATTNVADQAQAIATEIADSPYLDSTALNTTPYYYWVSATYGNGSTGLSPTQVLATPPHEGIRSLGAPPNLAASQGSAKTQITVTWNALPGGNKYAVWRARDGELSSAQSLTTTQATTSFIDTDVVQASFYTYWVAGLDAVDTNGLQESPVAGWTTGILPAPAQVKASRFAKIDRIRVIWEAVLHAATYTLLRRVAGGRETVTIEVGSATSYVDSDVERQVEYHYQVIAAHPNWAGSTSPEATGVSSGSRRLEPGWNLVGLAAMDTRPGDVLFADGGRPLIYDTLWSWDSVNNAFVTHPRNSVLEAHLAYWVFSRRGGLGPDFSGAPIAEPAPSGDSWILFNPGSSPRAVPDGWSAWSWDPLTHQFQPVATGSQLDIGYGYWLVPINSIRR
jgi:fibronectin type 3 domain-containing protein